MPEKKASVLMGFFNFFVVGYGLKILSSYDNGSATDELSLSETALAGDRTTKSDLSSVSYFASHSCVVAPLFRDFLQD